MICLLFIKATRRQRLHGSKTASPCLLETPMRCPQMVPSCGSPRPTYPVLATTLASLPMPWGRRPNMHSSPSWVSVTPPQPPGFPQATTVIPFTTPRVTAKMPESSQVSDLHSNPSWGPGFQHSLFHDNSCPNCSCRSRERNLQIQEAVSQKVPSSSAEPRKFRLNKSEATC